MRQQNQAERGAKVYQLHIDAGLADGGYDKKGNKLWIGTDQAWNTAESLVAQYLDTL